jgi:sulfur carrier protein ThiS
MRVRVKLMGVLKDKTPADGTCELPEGATVADFLKRMEIPSTSVQVLSVNGSFERNRERVLVDGDELTVLPPVGGG